jgi:hypothetical protein
MYISGKVIDQDTATGVRSVKIIAQSPKTRQVISSVFTTKDGEFCLALPDSAFSTGKENEFMVFLTATNWNYFPPEITLCASKDSTGKMVADYPPGKQELTISLKRWGGTKVKRKWLAYCTVISIFTLLLITGGIYYWKVLSHDLSAEETVGGNWASVEEGYRQLEVKFEALDKAISSIASNAYDNYRKLFSECPPLSADDDAVRSWKEALSKDGPAVGFETQLADFLDNGVGGLVAFLTRFSETPAAANSKAPTEDSKFRQATRALLMDLEDLRTCMAVSDLQSSLAAELRLRTVKRDAIINGLPWSSQRPILFGAIQPVGVDETLLDRHRSNVSALKVSLGKINEKLSILASWVRSEEAQSLYYWYHVFFWSLIGALLGLLWAIQRTIFDRNFDHGQWPSYLFRIVGSPLMASAFILLANYLGFTAETFAGVDVTAAAKPINIGLAVPIAFLSGLFMERLYRRLRWVADIIFKSDYRV